MGGLLRQDIRSAGEASRTECCYFASNLVTIYGVELDVVSRGNHPPKNTE